MTARLLKQTAAFTDQEWSAAQVTEQPSKLEVHPTSTVLVEWDLNILNASRHYWNNS